MSRQREDEDGKDVRTTSPHLGGGSAEEPLESDIEPGSDKDEAQPESEANGTNTDVTNEVEEAETQTDVTDDSTHVGEPQTESDVLMTAEEAETQTSDNVGNSTATVKVLLVPEGHVMTVAFVIGLSIQELKGQLASELRVPVEVLQLSLDGRVLEEKQSLMELGVQPHSATRLEMSSTDPTAHPLRPLRPPDHDNMPDVITVRVQTDDGALQEVVLEIERSRQQKTFLGGYRHRLTGQEYHHAAVQTLPKRRPDRGIVVYNRDTQTQTGKSHGQQTSVNVSTQTTRIGCYVSCMNDKLVTPGNYVTAYEYHQRRLKAVICLQSYARRWLAQKVVEQLKMDRDRRLAWHELREKRRRLEREEQLRELHQRWMRPQKKEDLDLLYQALEDWKCEQEDMINETMHGSERKAALCWLLEQEAELIASIGRQKIAVQNDNYDRAIRNFLDKSAAPHQWRAADGQMIQMDNQHTIRARELRDLYNDINLPAESEEQRHHILMTLKHTVKEHECQLTRDIWQLIDREVDLMSKRVKSAKLEGLRKRICTLFLQFIKKPAFNPEMAKLLKFPQKACQEKTHILRCISCHRYKGCAQVILAANARLSGRCQACVRLDNMARLHSDLSCYRNILSRLRDDEQQLNESAKIPFLLQVEDVQHMVEKVWTSCSALNASSELHDLVFVRWEREKDWSPWNCILLATEETSAHLEVQDVQGAYAATFIHGIKYKHMLAQRYFRQNPVMSEYLDVQPAETQTNQLHPKLIMTAEQTSDSSASSP
ncbi:IQ and ubiquitin-like domain-containing protein isoform X1 [Solea solea]|uniref:IQ and ubiquitin-like domain-containing protein isoform X1 n=2 Tax=Solea solea TaxID=90069 RepID=UPI00272C512B|nr:IQ and ubiquitin-like domain-containing protein isoform X1 [Solea solea]